MWRLWRRRRFLSGLTYQRAIAEAKLRAAERRTPMIEQLAGHLADLPAEELAARLRAAMTLRPE